MKLRMRLIAIVLAAVPLVLSTFFVETNSKAQAPPTSATPTKQDSDVFKDFPSLASGPPPKGVQDAINRSNGKIAYTGFVRRALGKKLGSPAFVAAAGVPKDATGKPKLEEMTADQVIRAVVETGHELSGGVAPRNLRLEAAKQNALADAILKKSGIVRAPQATAPLKNALTGDVLSSDLPRFDWRDYGWFALDSGIISQVKNQGDCGSCWAFATIGTFEGADALLNQRLISGSEQNLLDCYAILYGTAVAPFDCSSGGWWAFDQIINPGVADESAYPYQGQQQASCQDNVSTPFQAIVWKYVLDQGDIPSTIAQIKAIKNALCQYGPIGTAVYASLPQFDGSDGTTSIQDFPSGQLQTDSTGQQVYIDHLIAIVGWEDSKNAWVIKNSWGNTWGNQGFGYVDYFSNNIGYGSTYVMPVAVNATSSAGRIGALVPSVAQGLVPTIPKPQQQRKKSQ